MNLNDYSHFHFSRGVWDDEDFAGSIAEVLDMAGDEINYLVDMEVENKSQAFNDGDESGELQAYRNIEDLEFLHLQVWNLARQFGRDQDRAPLYKGMNTEDLYALLSTRTFDVIDEIHDKTPFAVLSCQFSLVEATDQFGDAHIMCAEYAEDYR